MIALAIDHAVTACASFQQEQSYTNKYPELSWSFLDYEPVCINSIKALQKILFIIVCAPYKIIGKSKKSWAIQNFLYFLFKNAVHSTK